MPTTNSSSPARVRPSRFVRSPVTSLMRLGPLAVSEFARSARKEFRFWEEVRNLARGGLEAVGAVHDVLLDARRQVRADRPGGCLLGIGSTHDLAIPRDRPFALEDLDHDGTRHHVLHEVAKERALTVHGIKTLGLWHRQTHHARGNDPKSCLLEAAIDIANHVFLDAIGLHDGQGAFYGHANPLSGRDARAGLAKRLARSRHTASRAAPSEPKWTR